MDILEKLISDRKQRKIKQKELCDFIGCSASALSRFEKGLSRNDFKIIEYYADYLGYEIRLLKR